MAVDIKEIKIDLTRDEYLDEYAKRTLRDRYLIEGETSPQHGFARAAAAFADDISHAQRLYDYSSNLWFMFSTPVLANGGTKRGLPISCFLQFVPDSREGIFGHETESGWLSTLGGGLGATWSALRTTKAKTSSGGESTGMVPFLSVMDRKVLACKQAGTRRAAYAAYLDISHPEIVEFLNIRKPSGGDTNRKCLNIHNAVNIPDAFMHALFGDDKWDLIDPASKEVKETVSARMLWEQILTLRTETGEPYLHFIDTTNRALPDCQRDQGLRVNTSNLCSEITLPTDENRTAVCCLSSVNLEKYDEWKNTSMVGDLVRMLDNVLDSFINAPFLKDSTRAAISKALYSASCERSIGLGAMGFHAYLQSKMIPFESADAHKINIEMFSYIRKEAEAASYAMGASKGIAPDFIEGAKTKGVFLRGSESPAIVYSTIERHYPKLRRNVHLMAIAPNASSSILCGNTSPSIEPYSACSFTQKTENGSHVFKNKWLQKCLEKKGLDEDTIKSIWRSVAAKKGSVQHITILEQHEKDVFKTAFEIDQKWVIEHAATRQRYIDQAQSVNLFVKTPVDAQYLHDLHYTAWEKGLKTLYYLRTSVAQKTEDVGEKIERKTIIKEESKPEKQTKFKTTTPTGFEIECYGCES